jgi:hypothetical protein
VTEERDSRILRECKEYVAAAVKDVWAGMPASEYAAMFIASKFSHHNNELTSKDRLDLLRFYEAQLESEETPVGERDNKLYYTYDVAARYEPNKQLKKKFTELAARYHESANSTRSNERGLVARIAASIVGLSAVVVGGLMISTRPTGFVIFNLNTIGTNLSGALLVILGLAILYLGLKRKNKFFVKSE